MENADKLMQLITAKGMDYGLKALGAIFILFVGSQLIKTVRKTMERFFDKKDFDETVEKFIVSATDVILWTVLVLSVLAKFGVEIAPVIASLGLLGFTVGFALQGSLSNFAAGIMLMILRPFKVGDYIEAGGSAGTVNEIALMSCVLTSPDNKKIMVPNANIFGNVITNVTALPTRRVDIQVGIGYGEDIDRAKEVCMGVLSGHEKTLSDPAPMVAVKELADSSVNLVLRVWVNTPDYWDVFFDCTESAKKNLDAAGIEIPFPQRTVWLNNVKTGE